MALNVREGRFIGLEADFLRGDCAGGAAAEPPAVAPGRGRPGCFDPPLCSDPQPLRQRPPQNLAILSQGWYPTAGVAGHVSPTPREGGYIGARQYCARVGDPGRAPQARRHSSLASTCGNRPFAPLGPGVLRHSNPGGQRDAATSPSPEAQSLCGVAEPWARLLPPQPPDPSSARPCAASYRCPAASTRPVLLSQSCVARRDQFAAATSSSAAAGWRRVRRMGRRTRAPISARLAGRH